MIIKTKEISSEEIPTRHGKLLALGEIVYGLSQSEQWDWLLYPKQATQLLNVLSTIPASDFLVFGSELTRFAACRYIQNLCASGILTLENYQANVGSFTKVIDSTLVRPEAALLEAASTALSELVNSLPQSAIDLSVYVKGVHPSNGMHQRSGFALTLGRLPSKALEPIIAESIAALSEAAKLQSTAAWNFAECRRDATLALISMVPKLVEIGVHQTLMSEVVKAFLNGLDDYASEARGDVGSWIRDASVLGLKSVLDVHASNPLACLDTPAIENIIASLLLTSLEKIDRVRETGGNVLCAILESPLEFSFKSELMYLLKEIITWIDPKQVYPLVAKALGVTKVQKHLVLGFALAIGGLTESLVKASSSSVTEFLRNATAQTQMDIVGALVQNFKENSGVDRVIVPLLELFDLLVSSGFVGNESAAVLYVFLPLVKTQLFKTKNTKKLLLGLKVYAKNLI